MSFNDVRFFKLLQNPRACKYAASIHSVFFDAKRKIDLEQRSLLADLLLVVTVETTVFRTQSWISHRSKSRPDSLGSAEMFLLGR